MFLHLLFKNYMSTWLNAMCLENIDCYTNSSSSLGDKTEKWSLLSLTFAFIKLFYLINQKNMNTSLYILLSVSYYRPK